MADQDAKNQVKFHTSAPQETLVESNSKLRPILKGLLYVGLLIGITYYAKFQPPEFTPTRNHGLLTWTFPTAQGIGVLWVLPDDGDDSNLEYTGHRIWIDPPRSPLELERNAARFRGPLMTVFTSEIQLSTIQELVQTIDSGGVLQIWSEIPVPQDFPQQLDGIDLSYFPMDSQGPTLSFTMSPSERVELQINPQVRNISYQTQGYSLLHHRGNQPPEGTRPWSFIFWSPHQDDVLEPWLLKHPDQIIISHHSDLEAQQDHHMIIDQESQAVISHENKGKIQLRKIKLKAWETSSQ